MTAVRWLIAALAAIGATEPAAWAAPGDDAGDDAEDDQPARKRTSDDEDGEFKKQDLAGRDSGRMKGNLFERDRFFVDKSDTSRTAKGTLVQGSITSTTFAYHESGGQIASGDAADGPVPSASQFDRMFTDLRLQTDFRHIGAGRWDARFDLRGRLVGSADKIVVDPSLDPASPTKVQSGWKGENELEIKEAWILRSGVRSDVFFGRQFISDLAGVRIDGLRIDYASSSRLTYLGFGGLYPIRGSRSITTDYSTLQSNPDNTGMRTSAGQFTGAAGFGAAYRTTSAYGSFGGVALVPFSSESPRIFGTSSGYWRYGAKLDFYHFAVLDLIGANAVNTGLTNLSLGLNYKPDQRLRGTLSFNRVDTETLNVQAQAFLSSPDLTAPPVIQNEAYLQRIATNAARASLSAGLGELQRFEITAATAFRYRGEVKLSPPGAEAATTVTLPAATSVEVYGAVTDRRSIADLRLGVDGSRTFGVGSSTYQRTETLALRAFAGRALANGHGEWEAEAAYASNNDDNAGVTCTGDVLSCTGASQSTIFSVGGNLYYRINRDWFVMSSLFLNRTTITHVEPNMSTDDPPVTGISGYLRAAYRF